MHGPLIFRGPPVSCAYVNLCCAWPAPPEEGHSDPAYEAAERQFEEESGPELRWETRLILGPGAASPLLLSP